MPHPQQQYNIHQSNKDQAVIVRKKSINLIVSKLHIIISQYY